MPILALSIGGLQLVPRDSVAHPLDIKQGQWLYVTSLPDGGVRLTPYDPDFARQMTLAEEIMHDDREVLRALSR